MALRSAAAREQGGGGLAIGGAQDPAEKAADRAADRVMSMARPGPLARRACAECGEEGEGRQVRAKAAPGAAPVAPGAASAAASVAQSKAIGALGGGRPLASAERAFFEPRFGADLAPVRVHDGPAADRAGKAIGARAFSVGNDIAFARGEYSPGTDFGRRLMAHELAHTLEDGPARRSIRRKSPEAADPLCGTYVFSERKTLLEGDVETLAKGGDREAQLKVIQDLKIFHRCASETEITEIKAYLTGKLGAEQAGELWKSAGTVFGGYRGVYPGYYSGKKWLSGLGTSEAEATPTFNFPEPSLDPKIFDPRGEKIASALAKKVERADILYFYGHQYAQKGNPGAFANEDQDKFFDVRKMAGKGNFDRVKLIISTSCATICKEALDEFTQLFPNAVILGYRKSAPGDGAAVRRSFDKSIKSLKKPLLLDEPIDIAAIINVWKAVVKSHHPKEEKRLPGYYQGGTVYYLKKGLWESMAGSAADNACVVKSTQIQRTGH